MDKSSLALVLFRVEPNFSLLGNHWSKLPTLPRHKNNYLHELCYNRKSSQGTWCCCQKLTGKISEGPKEGRRRAIICPATLSEILTGGNHLDWEMCTLPGRFLSQNKLGHRQDDWPEATWKANPIIITPETAASHVASSSPVFLYPATLLLGSQWSLLLC